MLIWHAWPAAAEEFRLATAKMLIEIAPVQYSAQLALR
jgi:hypothetical protein